MSSLSGRRALRLTGWFVLFAAAATLNAGGYRWGASDQAFYIPAVFHHLDWALFPRDWALLGPQDRLGLFAAGAAALVRATGVTVQQLFLGLYAAGLLALFCAARGIGSRLYASQWTVLALTAALTLRHAVALGAVNTLEGYMHPRMLAFGAGGLAVAAVLASRPLRACLLVAAALALHPTTAVWFAIWLGVALAVADARFRRPLLLAGSLAAVAGGWAVGAGPLAGSLGLMDDVWVSVLGPRKYLFPTGWPVDAWALVAAYVAAIAAIYRARLRRGLVTRAEHGIVAGAAALFAVFLASLPFTAARLAIAVQLQVGRVLWMLDLLAVAYVVWYLAEGLASRAKCGAAGQSGPGARAGRTLAFVLLLASLSRGGYSMLVEHPERSVVQPGLAAGQWRDAMQWVEANTPKDDWVLAAPGHAWKYGSSVRVAARRDVYLEESKDTSIAMYSREAAMTVLDRIRRVQSFDTMSDAEFSALAADLGPGILVTERRHALPLLYSNDRFAIYRLGK